MAKAKAGKEIIIDPDKLATIVCGDVRVVFNKEGGVAVFGNVPVTVHPAVNDSVEPQLPAPLALDPWSKEALDQLKDGDFYPDGTVRFGEKLTLRDGFYRAAMPHCAPKLLDHYDALSYAKDLNAHGHNDYSLPDSKEGRALYGAKDQGALKGMFSSVRYLWLAERSNDGATVQWFGDGSQDYFTRDNRRSACAVRRFKPLNHSNI